MANKISRSHVSEKHSLIDRTNSKTLLAVAFTTFIVIFCAFAVRSLISQSLYYGRIISEKEIAKSQLEENTDNIEKLSAAYVAFESEQQNILGGNASGEGPIDGNNVNIVLDALPSKYDYPALSSSIEKLLRDGGYQIERIGGTEDSTLGTNEAVGNPQPIEVPYEFSFISSADRAKDFMRTLERSIRPMNIKNLRVTATSDQLLTRVSLYTYFAQEKSFEVRTKEVN